MNTNLFLKQIQNNDPSLWLLKFESTCTQTRERKTKIQIIRISRISQYIEVKSEKILKKSNIYHNIHKNNESNNAYTSYRDVNWQVMNNINEPNKLDHRCLLKWRNTWSNYLVHNTYIEKLQVDKYTNIKDLIEIHGFHNIWSEIRKNIEEIHKTIRISGQILQNTANIRIWNRSKL